RLHAARVFARGRRGDQPLRRGVDVHPRARPELRAQSDRGRGRARRPPARRVGVLALPPHPAQLRSHDGLLAGPAAAFRPARPDRGFGGHRVRPLPVRAPSDPRRRGGGRLHAVRDPLHAARHRDGRARDRRRVRGPDLPAGARPPALPRPPHLRSGGIGAAGAGPPSASRLAPRFMTRLAVFAYSDTGHACLKHLLEHGERIVFLATHRDHPDEARWFPSVAELAKSHGIEPFIMENPLDAQSIVRLRVARPDLVLSFYYRRILPDEMLEEAPLGAFNMHGSLLPRFRGRAPVNWAIVKGETKTGATLHRIRSRADTAEIVDQEAVPIGPDDTAIEVQRRVTAAAVEVLARRLEELKAGTAPAVPQDESKATRFGRRRPEDGRIDWSRPAREVHDLVRAVTHPFPGAFTDLFGGKTFVWRTRLPGLARHDTLPGQGPPEENRPAAACRERRTP